MGISAVVLTYNDESRIERCLRSLSFVDEIVVLDSFSTDRTLEIAGRFTDRISRREFRGFAEQRKAGLELATHEWLLIVDSDEVVPEELAREMLKAAQSESIDGCRVPRLTFFLGKPIRHCGWYPAYSFRLVRKASVSFGDRLVHEKITVEGQTADLKTDLLHYSYESMEDAVRKTMLYSQAAARQKFAEGRRFRLVDLLFRPGLMFLKKYFVQQGFRDGMRGFIICALMQCGIFLRYAALWQMSMGKEQMRDE